MNCSYPLEREFYVFCSSLSAIQPYQLSHYQKGGGKKPPTQIQVYPNSKKPTFNFIKKATTFY